jgi:hypothetical protein
MKRVSVMAALLLSLVGCSRESEGTWDLGPASPPAEERPSPQPVAAHRSQETAAGYRGEVHPLLQRQAPLTVTAAWSPIEPGRALDFGFFPERFYSPFLDLEPAQLRREVDARLLSGLLPHDVEKVGQVWSLDSPRVREILSQFHSSASTELAAPGRRAGPNGAFGVVRALSPTHADLMLRVHAEFPLERDAYVTPSSFMGRLILNRQAETVEYFRLSVPHDKALNTTLTVRLETEALIDIVNVESMELTAGDPQAAEQVEWSEALEPAVAEKILKQHFYRFVDIDWVPPEQAVAKAQELDKPIMAVVLWGNLDEQNC